MGRLGAPFGVKGWIRVLADTEHPDSLAQFAVWHLQNQHGQWSIYKVEKTELHANGLVVKLQGIEDRDAAFALKNQVIAVDRTEFQPANPNEFYWADLIGLHVFNQQNEALGIVDSLFETGANDVLVVKDTDGQTRLLPFVGHIILEVQLAEKKILVDWGLDY